MVRRRTEWIRSNPSLDVRKYDKSPFQVHNFMFFRKQTESVSEQKDENTLELDCDDYLNYLQVTIWGDDNLSGFTNTYMCILSRKGFQDEDE